MISLSKGTWVWLICLFAVGLITPRMPRRSQPTAPKREPFISIIWGNYSPTVMENDLLLLRTRIIPHNNVGFRLP